MGTNCVLAGKCEGGVIRTDNNNKAYVEHNTKTASGYIVNLKWYFDKTNVISIEKINEESSDYKREIGFWFGSMAAAGASDVKDVILKITWRDNTESMIKVREGLYTKILATSMSDVPGALHLKNEAELKKWEEEHAEEIKRQDAILKDAANNPKPKELSPQDKKRIARDCLITLGLLGAIAGSIVLILVMLNMILSML